MVLIAAEYIAGIYFLLHIIQAGIIAVGDNGLTLFFEGIQIIHDLTAEKCTSIFQCRLINNYFCSLGFNTLHHPLNG